MSGIFLLSHGKEFFSKMSGNFTGLVMNVKNATIFITFVSHSVYIQIIDIVDNSLHCTSSEELYNNLVSILLPF